jgi:hypothetical protein
MCNRLTVKPFLGHSLLLFAWGALQSAPWHPRRQTIPRGMAIQHGGLPGKAQNKKALQNFAVRRNLQIRITTQPVLFNLNKGEDHG